MKKTLAISLVLCGMVFLAGCTQGPVSQTQSTTAVPVAQKPPNNRPVTTQTANEIVNWKNYSNLGVSLKYPNDGSYSIETPEAGHFIITQEHPGNRIHVNTTTDLSMVSSDAKTKNINDISYKVFYQEGMGDGYGYVVEHKGQFYVFESVIGPENEVFELMMTTVKFE